MRHNRSTTRPNAPSETATFVYGPQGGVSIIAVHGFRGTHHGLVPLAGLLAQDGFRVIAPDLPGCGESTPMQAEHNATNYGAWLAALVDSVPSPRVLLGHSFGTVIVGAAIAQGVGHEGAILINPILTAPLKGPRQAATLAARSYYSLARHLPTAMAHRLLASRTIAGIAGTLMASTPDPALRQWIRQEHRRQAGSFATREAVLEAFAASTTTTLADYADKFTQPTLVLGADRDPLSPAHAFTPEHSRLRSATFRLFPNRGHLLPFEETHEVAHQIGRWLQAEVQLTKTAPSSSR